MYARAARRKNNLKMHTSTREIDPVLKDIIANDTFHKVHRGRLAGISFPAEITQIGAHLSFHKHLSTTVTDITTMSYIPSKSSCEGMLKSLSLGKYHAVTSQVGTLDKSSLEVILKIHSLKEIAKNVKEEQKWLTRNATLPNENCSLSQGLIENDFENLLFNHSDGTVVVNKTILPSDLATLTGDNWLNISIIQGFVDLLNDQNTDTVCFVLNNLIGLKKSHLRNIAHKQVRKQVKFLTFIVNVGGNIHGTFTGKPGKQGCHWALLHIDVKEAKWFYCDTLGWPSPKDLTETLNVILAAFSSKLPLLRKPVKGRFLAHKPHTSRPGIHNCSNSCCQNIPLQACGSICGVIATVMAAISCNAANLWRYGFLDKDVDLPHSIKWLLHPSTHGTYLRRVLINWLMTKQIDLTKLGFLNDDDDNTVSTPHSSINKSNCKRPMNATVDWDGVLKNPKRCVDDPVLEQDDTKENLLDDDDDDDDDDNDDDDDDDDGPEDPNRLHPAGTGQETIYIDDDDDLYSSSEVPDQDPTTQSNDLYSSSKVPDQDPTTQSNDLYSSSKVPDQDPTTQSNDLYSSSEVPDQDPTTQSNDLYSSSEVPDQDPTTQSNDLYSSSEVPDQDPTTQSNDLYSSSKVPDQDPTTQSNDLYSSSEVPDQDPTTQSNDLYSSSEVPDQDPTTQSNDDDLKKTAKLSYSKRQHDTLQSDDDDNFYPKKQKPPNQESEIGRKVNSDDGIDIGSTYESYEELEMAIRSFEKINFVQLYKRRSRGIAAYAKKCPKKKLNPDLMFSEIEYACMHGGKNFRSKSKGNRPNQHTFQMGCPVVIRLRCSIDGTKLIVKDFIKDHNHGINKGGFKYLPRQRAIDSKTKAEVKLMLSMKANKKLVQQHISKGTGKAVTLKDIHNLVERKDGGLEELIQEMKRMPGAKVEIYTDEKRNFKGLYYQDQDMREMFAAYPGILLIDATYKLNDLRLPLYVMLVVDGNGESEIVGLMLVADEDQDTIRQMMSFFKAHNPCWKKIDCIMSDKDMTEREVLAQELPQAVLLICLFHTMRSFKREITTEKMGLSNDERLQVLELLQSMAYAKHEDAYQVHYKELMNTRFGAVKKYFNENWHLIREQWVEGLKKKYKTLLNSTNNRLESINQKFKSVVSRHSRLLEFHEKLQACLASLRAERDYRAACVFQKRPVTLHNLEHVERQYFHHCTPYAFNQIKEQLQLTSRVGTFSKDASGLFSLNQNLIVSTDDCQCAFFTSMKLPCRHMFALRKELNCDLFSKSLCDERWTKDYYSSCHRILKGNTCNQEHIDDLPNDLPDDCVSVNVKKEQEPTKILSQHEKYRKAFGVAQKLASVASETTGKLFRSHLELLQQILSAWQQGKEVTCSLSKVKDECSKLTSTDEDCSSSFATDIADLTNDDEPVNLTTTSEDDTNCSEEVIPTCEVQSRINMPPRMLRRGRPKGADLTVIGLPSKKKRRKWPTLFINKSPTDKAAYILNMLTTPEVVHSALTDEKLITEGEIEQSIDKIHRKIVDQTINVYRVKKYFTNSAWKIILILLKKIEKEKSWDCKSCDREFKESDVAVGCDACLEWFHVKCIGKAAPPKAKTWVCRTCVKITAA